MKSKLANRSDRQQRHGRHQRRVGHHGLSRQSNGKFLMLSPEEQRTQQAAQRKFAIKEAEKKGLAPVKTLVANIIRTLGAGVPIETPLPRGMSGTHASLSLVPKSIADMIRHWEEAQDFAGPAGHVVEFRSLRLETVVELAVVEWQEQQKNTGRG